MSADRHAWARAVVARVGLPLDPWAVLATLEAEGLRDADAPADLGAADLRAFAQDVYAEAVALAPPATAEATSPALATRAERLGRLRRHLVDGMFFSLPVAVQVACALALRHSLFSSLDFGVRDAAVVGLAMAASTVSACATALTVGHQAEVHLAANDAPHALAGAVAAGVALSVAVLAGVALAWLLAPSLVTPQVAWFGAHFASLAALWVALALLYALRMRWWVVGVSLAGALAVNALVREAGLRAHAALVAGALLATALAAVLIVQQMRRVAHAPPLPSAARVREDFRVGALAPHLAYSAGYFALVCADRVLVWTSAHTGAALLSRYELGMSWAFATLVVPTALAEHLAVEFQRRVDESQHAVTLASIAHLRASAGALLARSAVLLALVGLGNTVVVWFAGRALVTRWIGLPVDALTERIFVLGAAGYQLLVSGLFIGLVHFLYARRATPARALWRAVFVGVAIGYALTRALGPPWAVATFVVGAFVFAAQMIPAGLRLCARIDHAHYAAY